MFEMHIIQDQNCPVLVCDMCGERLTEAGKSAVVFDNFASPGSKIKVLHVHKGQIEGKTCHQEADAIIKSGGGTPGWQEMKACITDLAHNIGFPPHEMDQYNKTRGDSFSE